MQPTVRKLTFGQSLQISGFSVRFKALSYLQEYSPHKILKKNQELYLLGQSFMATADNIKEVNASIYNKFCNIPWMTYRSGFKELRSQKGDSYVTDSGWECMIRSGQNCIAQILKKHLKLQTKQQLSDILKLFDDFDQNQMFSIQNIVNIATKQYQLELGTWYNPSQIIFIIQELFNKHSHNPYRQTLNILIMNNASLFYDQIIMRMTEIKQLCNCQKKGVICNKCYKNKKSLTLIFLVRIGLGSPQTKYLRCLDKLLESKHFQGIVGGKPTKALYMIGKQDKNLIYLDPHLVHNAVGQHNFEKQKQSYFCQSFRSCSNTSIDPSMAISFYFQNLEDVDEFYEFMTKLKQDAPDDFFFYMSIETPEWMKKLDKKQQDQQAQ